jgi:FkbM family methyltransferase
VPHAWAVELDWIRANVDLGPGRNFIDAGCHHGLYAVALGGECNYFGVDLHERNLDLLQVNAALNGIVISYAHAAIANVRGYAMCFDLPLGGLDDEGKDQVLVVKLGDVCKEPHVVKMDIEGAEWLVIPECLDELPGVDTWIVEIHPWYYDPHKPVDLFTPFHEHGFNMLWVDRAAGDIATVEPLISGDVRWLKESTLLAVKP